MVVSRTASYLQNCCPRLEVYPRRRSSLPARALYSSGQHTWSSQTAIWVNWLHSSTTSTNIGLHSGVSHTIDRPFVNSLSATLRDSSVSLHTFNQRLKTYLFRNEHHPLSMALLHKTPDLLTYINLHQKSLSSRARPIIRTHTRARTITPTHTKTIALLGPLKWSVITPHWN